MSDKKNHILTVDSSTIAVTSGSPNLIEISVIKSNGEALSINVSDTTSTRDLVENALQLGNVPQKIPKEKIIEIENIVERTRVFKWFSLSLGLDPTTGLIGITFHAELAPKEITKTRTKTYSPD